LLTFDTMEQHSFLIIIGSILFSAFFAGIEIAFISANKLLIELKNKQGSLSAKILSPFVSNPSKFISTTLVGNNIGLIVYGIYMAKILEAKLVLVWDPFQHNHYLLVLCQTIISTLIVLITAKLKYWKYPVISMSLIFKTIDFPTEY